MKHVATGLQFLHSNGIVHRDIKPANILYDSFRNWKITDFGLSRLIDTSMTSESGTPDYFAPEQVGKNYDWRVDIYAFGLVAFEIGFPMKSREDRRHWFTIFRTGQPSFPDATKRLLIYSSAFDDLVKAMTKYSLEKRITLDEVVRILNFASSECQNRTDLRPRAVISYRTAKFNEKFKNIKRYRYSLTASAVCKETNEPRHFEFSYRRYDNLERKIRFFCEIESANENLIKCFGIWNLDSRSLNEEWRNILPFLTGRLIHVFETEYFASKLSFCPLSTIYNL